MAINTEALKNGGKQSTFRDFSQSAGQSAEGGNELVLAMTAQVQGQAMEMVKAAHAADISIEHASTQMAEYFTDVLSGRALLNATMAKVQANLEQQGSVTIDTDVQPIDLNLPRTRDYGSVRQRFLTAFGGSGTADELPSVFLKSAEDSDGEHDR